MDPPLFHNQPEWFRMKNKEVVEKHQGYLAEYKGKGIQVALPHGTWHNIEQDDSIMKSVTLTEENSR